MSSVKMQTSSLNTPFSFRSFWNFRNRTILLIVFTSLVLISITIAGIFMPETSYGPKFQERNLGPSLQYFFGTDWMGRNMFNRTIKGLSTSLFVGVSAALVSAIVALVLGILAATSSKKIDSVILYLIDLVQGLPQLILLMLISFVLGKGLIGVVTGIALTHWTILARVIRAEVLSIRNTQYVLVARKLGQNHWGIIKHILPHIFPQFLIGLILLFPQAILHEAALTFLGFGLLPREPSVGMILSESVKYLTAGIWWLTALPGLCLLFLVLVFDGLGNGLKRFMRPSKI